MLKKLFIIAICIAVLGSIGIGCKQEATPAEEAAPAEEEAVK
ncbi:unnamed protein product, partial [marine sediment metagenome]